MPLSEPVAGRSSGLASPFAALYHRGRARRAAAGTAGPTSKDAFSIDLSQKSVKATRSSLFIGAGVALAALAVLVLTAWGFYLTSAQSLRIERYLHGAARLQIESRLGAILDQLRAVEDEILADLGRLAAELEPGDPAFLRRLEDIERRHREIARPFFLAADFGFHFPQRAERDALTASALLADEPAPEDFEKAMALLWGGGSPAEAERTLQAVSQAPELAGPWRFRALAALAGLHLRRQNPRAAVAAYERLWREFPEDVLRRSSHPSRLQLALAHAQALEAAGERGAAEDLLERTLTEIEAGAAPDGAERLFVAQVRRVFAIEGEIPRPPPPRADGETARDRVRRRLAEIEDRFEMLHRAENARELMTLPAHIKVLASGGPAPAGANRFAESASGKRRLFVWQAGPVAAGGERLAAVGFQYDVDVLPAAIDRLLARQTGGDGDGAVSLRAFGSDGGAAASLDGGSGAPRVALPGELAAVSIGVAGDSWRQQLQDARRPYRIANVLLPTLGLVTALALLAFHRSYRRERHLSRLKTDFVANVSHELKTPLALIRLFGETLYLERVPDASRRKEYYQIITRESERLTHLINNVLDFASIEADRKTYDLTPTDLGAVVGDTVRSYKFQLEEKGFALVLDVAPGLPSVAADPNAVAQALINLINNAIKYSTEIKELRIRAWRAGDSIRVSVADRGVGILEEDFQRIFEGFYRSRTARDLGRRGSGLGLPLVQHIVRSHGGRVELESVPGQGSTFTLIFPIRPAGAAAGAGGAAPAAPGESRSPKTGWGTAT
jgi:signal transduction histidine kinase